MTVKRTIVRKLVDVTHDWNSELHLAIEARINDVYREMISEEARESQSVEASCEMKDKMRTFYYSRMSMTASLLLTGVAVIISVLALLVSLF